MELWIAPFRLKFRHPFGTAHGFRDGTDSVFIKLVRNGIAGYGEATMPPYVKEDQRSVIESLERVDLEMLDRADLEGLHGLGPCARAGISTAFFDLVSREKDVPIGELLQVEIESVPNRISLITLGLCPIDEIASKLDQLPKFNGLKIKLNGDQDEQRLKVILKHDPRPILIDANQAWHHLDQAFKMIDLIPPERLIGFEQPFAVDRTDLQLGLMDRSEVTVYADESIQTLNDLYNASEQFNGVNLKLMKCGGLDMAVAMARLARSNRMKVMLGSMSESSIGCAAMFQLAPIAQVLDLDGPWLIANDPSQGLDLVDGELHLTSSRSPATLIGSDWTPIGA